MTTDATTEQPEKREPEKVPWYTLNPKHMHFSRVTRIILYIAGVVLLFSTVSVKPLWQLGWRTHLYCLGEFLPVRSATGKTMPGGGWTRSKTIYVYCAPGVDNAKVGVVAISLQRLIDELGLDLTVKALAEPPKGAVESLKAATKDEEGGPFMDFDGYRRRRCDDRQMRYAEMVIVNNAFLDPSWAHGISEFSSGMAMLQESYADRSLARHEGAHLIGYGKHDDYPWYILGYKEALNPQQRDTLMMLMPTISDGLSPRARDALLNFWRGMERRDRVAYFRKGKRP